MSDKARDGSPATGGPAMTMPEQVTTLLSALQTISTLPAVRALMEFGSSTAPEACRRIAATLIGLLLAAGLLGTSLVFFTQAAHRALVSNLGEIGAALILGIVYLIASLLFLLSVHRRAS